MIRRAPKAADRQGMALLVVMVIVVLVALAAYGFNQQMTDTYRLSQLEIERAQARLTAMSAVDALRMAIERPRGQRMGWHRTAIDSFAGVPLEEDASVYGDADASNSAWSFSVIAPSDGGTTSLDSDPEKVQSWRFGLTNESAKLNLSVLSDWDQAQPGQAKLALMNLPGMDETMASALMRAYGISDSSRSKAVRLSDRLGAMATQGSSSMGQQDSDASQTASRWAMLWNGGDWDQNYQLDSLELALMGQATVETTAGIDPDPLRSSSSGAAPLAWRDYLTFDSGQRNVNLTGNRRIFINGKDLQSLHQELLAIWPAEWANFVIAARQFGIARKRAGGKRRSSASAAEWTPDLSIPASTRLRTSLELVGVTVEIPESDDKVLRVRSPFTDDFGDPSNYLRALVDDVTTNPSPVILGQVDVMDAPREVLLGIPGLSTETVGEIVERRGSPAATDQSRDTIAWLLIENVVDLPALQKMQPWITVGGDCYHAQIVAFRDALTPTFRCTVSLDGCSASVPMRNYREWNAWGQGFSIDELRADTLPTE
ncbi:hypothetical protein [Novipirellula artificiosorum]|uniref:General secretion pathway protein K n=1 Tax=Novipirellula artificiosorum TaxID=2528016 RepID=A0A5C6DPE6_9BACT|nr:hypothetical protein [Novipirellula artificiosorum]TWU38482.1 hypothetical protein Poly41_29580 [Novipirellula artificiosorum]